MKIKLLREIPGYKAGETFTDNGSLIYTHEIHIGSEVTTRSIQYDTQELIELGYVEKVTEEIDMEEVRKDFQPFSTGSKVLPSKEEIIWFSAYRIVKHVIDTLNGDWEFDKEKSDYYAPCVHDHGKLTTHNFICRSTILPSCKNLETVEKVISLCEPELKVLFGVTS